MHTIGQFYDCVFLRLGEFWWNLGRCQFLLVAAVVVVVVVAMSSDLFHRCSLCRTPSSSPCSGGPEVNAPDTSFAVFLDGKQLFFFRMIFSGVELFFSGQKHLLPEHLGGFHLYLVFFDINTHWKNKFQGIAWLWSLFNGIAVMIMMIITPSKPWRQVSKKNQTTVRRIGRFVIQHASNSRNVLVFLYSFWVSNHSRFDF